MQYLHSSKQHEAMIEKLKAKSASKIQSLYRGKRERKKGNLYIVNKLQSLLIEKLYTYTVKNMTTTLVLLQLFLKRWLMRRRHRKAIKVRYY